ncbi:MAG: UDP-3-O-(3-hydroxymyristoyl)glucosamine N-acyltransferase, partial [Woeseia sp.]
AVIVRADDAADCSVNTLITDDPYLCYARIAAVLHPLLSYTEGVHASAVVDDSVSIGAGTHIGPNACIAGNCVLGARVYVGAGCVVEAGVHVGDDTRLMPNSTLMHGVQIGARCIVHPGAVIGADGFGNAMSRDGWVKVPQIGSVTIGDDVEIGASTTVDRGSIENTVIANGVRLDNQIQIGHNVRIGEHTALAAMVGIAGSAVIGKRCMIAGMSGLVGHITLCDDVIIGGATMVTKDITSPGVYVASFPAEPDGEWKRQVARFRRLGELTKRVRQLEKGKSDNE